MKERYGNRLAKAFFPFGKAALSFCFKTVCQHPNQTIINNGTYGDDKWLQKTAATAATNGDGGGGSGNLSITEEDDA